MNPILFLSLVFILAAALPWWPYSAYGRARHHRPWDWLFDTPSSEDIKIFYRQREALGRGPTLEASQKAAMKPCDDDAEVLAKLRRQFDESRVRSQRQATTYELARHARSDS